MLEKLKNIINNFDYKQMKYSENRQVQVLLKGKHKNYDLFILSLGTHPTAYVSIPINHPYFEKTYNDFDIDVHGGLTLTERDFNFNPIQTEKGWWIGWDYAHCGDYAGYNIRFKGTELDSENDKKWTTEEIFQDVINVIEQLIEVDHENNR